MKQALLFALVTALTTSSIAAPPAAHSLVGHRAPQFVLNDSAGGKVSLSEMQHGSVVVVTALASWSPVCRTAMPELVAFASTHPELAFVGIAVTERQGIIGVQQFISQFQVPFPIAMGDRAFERDYHTTSLPTTFVIDGTGTIRAVLTGEEVRLETIRSVIRQLGR
jgi:peroxiredoxin